VPIEEELDLRDSYSISREHAKMLQGVNSARVREVRTIPIPKIENQKPKEDPLYPAAVERAKEAVRRLQEMGIIDAEGRRIRRDPPPDM
jgi:hypothetical protein